MGGPLRYFSSDLVNIPIVIRLEKTEIIYRRKHRHKTEELHPHLLQEWRRRRERIVLQTLLDLLEKKKKLKQSELSQARQDLAVIEERRATVYAALADGDATMNDLRTFNRPRIQAKKQMDDIEQTLRDIDRELAIIRGLIVHR
jgi:hypothetical protein